jgi:hypothetical protein
VKPLIRSSVARTLLLLVFFSYGYIASAQTKYHKPIVGSKYSMVPPEGFVPSKKFTGFEDPSVSGFIMVSEVPAAFQEMADGFTEGAMFKKGMKLTNKRDLDFHGGKALYITATQAMNGQSFHKQILIFGDSTKTVMVNGGYPEEMREISKDVERAIMSIWYNEKQNADANGAAAFKIDVGNTGFKYVMNFSGGLMYSLDGKAPAASPPHLLVAGSFTPLNISDRRQFSIDRLKKLPGAATYIIDNVDEITIDSLKGFEITAVGMNKDKKEELLYQVILYGDDKYYYMIVGKAAEDLGTNLQKFKTIARTFRRN